MIRFAPSVPNSCWIILNMLHFSALAVSYRIIVMGFVIVILVHQAAYQCSSVSPCTFHRFSDSNQLRTSHAKLSLGRQRTEKRIQKGSVYGRYLLIIPCYRVYVCVTAFPMKSVELIAVISHQNQIVLNSAPSGGRMTSQLTVPSLWKPRVVLLWCVSVVMPHIGTLWYLLYLRSLRVCACLCVCVHMCLCFCVYGYINISGYDTVCKCSRDSVSVCGGEPQTQLSDCVVCRRVIEMKI